MSESLVTLNERLRLLVFMTLKVASPAADGSITIKPTRVQELSEVLGDLDVALASPRTQKVILASLDAAESDGGK